MSDSVPTSMIVGERLACSIRANGGQSGSSHCANETRGARALAWHSDVGVRGSFHRGGKRPAIEDRFSLQCKDLRREVCV
jgi:hypothetical protein